MPDRFLEDMQAGQPPDDGDTQQLVEAESGKGTQGINRRWQASDSARVVLTSDSTGVKISRDNGVTAPAQVVVDGTPAGGNLAGTYPNPTLSAAIMDALVPPGTIIMYATAGTPAGWLFCNGAAVSRTTYAKLFGVIGTAWGAGDGSTTFNLPNLAGRVLLGSGGAYTFATLGGLAAVPGPLHTHTGSHSHGLNGHTHTLGTHTHTLGTHNHDLNAHTHGLNDHAHTLASHTHAVDLDHNHAAAAAAATATATASNSILNGTGASTSVPAATHTHPVDLPALGGTPKTSDGPAPSNTSLLTGAATLGTPAGAVTAGPTGGSGGPTGASDGATSATATDATAPAAAYTETIPTLPPYAVASYIIRSG